VIRSAADDTVRAGSACQEFTYWRDQAVSRSREAGFERVAVEKLAGLPFLLMKLRKTDRES
jgi:hypothetical protein